MRKLLLISTGGTISQGKDTYSTIHVVESKGAEAFSGKLGKSAPNLEITPREVMNKDSSNIIPGDWLVMIDTIVEEYDNYDAFLISRGTNTLGYTCAALSFALGNLGKPVILTGSQVPYVKLSSDAVMNLENAIRVAAEPEPLLGVVAVFGSQIITGARVKKTTEFEYDAFRTFNANNSLGRIGRVLRWNRAALKHHNSHWQPGASRKTLLDVQPNFDMNIVSLTEFPGLKLQFFKSLIDSGLKSSSTGQAEQATRM